MLSAINLRLDEAQGQAVRACAESIGITAYQPLAPTPPGNTPGVGRFGLEDAAIAESSGYVVNAGPVDLVGDPASNLPDAEAAALTDALFGTDAEDVPLVNQDGVQIGRITLGDGCLRDFYSDFFGSIDTYVRFLELRLGLEQARLDAQTLLYADQAYLTLVADWEACMINAGYEVNAAPTGPAVLIDGPLGLPSGPDVDRGDVGWPEPRPSELETQMAIADVECKQSTDFVPAATDLLILHETEIADRIGLAELDTELREISQSSGTG